jgi:hypothetical protein
VQSAIAFQPATWMSASLVSFVVAALATLVIGRVAPEQRTRPPEWAGADSP